MSDDPKEWLLDTATISHVQRGREPWASRVLALPEEERRIPVVVVEEQTRGRLAQIRLAETKGDHGRLLLAYLWLGETARFFGDVTIVPFDAAALRR